MITQLPISVANKPIYQEGSGLASIRDSRSIPQWWKRDRQVANSANANMQAMRKMQRDITRLKHRVIGMPQATPIFPFKIYQIQNVSATDAQKKQFTDLGLNIDDYTVQIRSGFVSGRPFQNPFSTQYLFDGAGNFEQWIYCENTDSPSQNPYNGAYPPDYFFYDAIANPGVTTIIDDTTDTLIDGIPLGFTPGTQWKRSDQICLNPKQAVGNFDQFQNSSAAFWIEIIDDPINGFWANLMGRMFSIDVGSTRTLSPFPTGPNIIPIGSYQMLANLSGSSYTPLIQGPVTQYLTGHAVNRWAPASSTFVGLWSELFASLPPSATQLTFYPGDIVIDNTVSNPFVPSALDSTNYYGTYKMISANPISAIVGGNPQGDPTNWLMIGFAPAP